MLVAWYWRQSQIENGDSRSICQEIVRFQNSCAAPSGWPSSAPLPTTIASPKSGAATSVKSLSPGAVALLALVCLATVLLVLTFYALIVVASMSIEDSRSHTG